MLHPTRSCKMIPGQSAIDRGQRTLAAIVLTDAVGFSARMSANEEDTLTLIHSDLRLIETLCKQYEGRVIKSMGDGLLLYFMSAVQAVQCSLEMQRQLTLVHQQREIEDPLQHRIGVHLGDVFFRNSDVMGNGVNIAARLQTEAHPGGICISQIVYDVVKSKLTLNATYAGPLRLKNIQELQPAYHLYPATADAITLPENPSQKPNPATTGAGGLNASQGKPAGEFQSARTEPDVEFTIAPSAPRPHASKRPIAGNPRDRLAPGSKVGGRYRVQRILGQGGFGRSYLVEDAQRFGELCVLKEFFPASTSSRNLQKALDLFKREAKTLYQINHPQIPTFMACFTQSQRLFIVQEYINGVTYAQLLKQRKREGRRFSTEEVIQWLIHMLQVLEYLHDLNVVHRDISPDNIIYSSDRGLPVLIDFGLVNDAMNDILSSEQLEPRKGEKSATIVGKLGYSPPEQLQLGQCYPSSDLYALGVTAIVLLTGRYPRELINQGAMEWDWQRYVSLPPGFAELLSRMTHQRPNMRFQSAREVLEIAIRFTTNATSPLPSAVVAPIDLAIDPTVAPEFIGPLQQGQKISPDPVFLDQCRQELTRSVGPIASVLIEDVLEQNPEASPQELVSLLAAQLSDGNQAEEFTSRIFANPSYIQHSQTFERTRSTKGTAAGALRSEVRDDPKFVARCRDALAQSIGPMADFLVEEILVDNPDVSPREFIFQLASEIPDAAKAREFQQKLL